MIGSKNHGYQSLQPIRRRIATAWATPGRELEQSLLRLTIGGLVLAYLLHGAAPGGLSAPVTRVVVLFLIVAALITASIMLRPRKSISRRVFAMVLDNTAITGCMYVTGPSGAALYPLYLWVTFGNGFRFGHGYLYASCALSLAGFTFVVLASSHWRDHSALSAGLLIGLIMLPAYVSALLRRLNAAVRRSEAANQAKSQFLAKMTHELRTPLNGIVGTNDLLRETPLNREQRELTDTIGDSVRTLLSLIENVLDFSKIEANKLGIERTRFDLHHVLNNTIRMLRPQAQSKDLALRLQIAPDVPFRLHGDPHHLHQVLVNLIGNAIKFTARGTVDVRVSLVGEGPARVHVRFEIIDTGIGIAPEVLDRIFDHFTQADESTTRHYGGSGLGTTIAKQLVELMGGQIHVSSQPDLGSRFWFELPLTKQAPGGPGTRTLEGLRLLLVSEADDRHGMLMQWLRRWQVDVTVVSTASEARECLVNASSINSTYDAVLIHKPTLDIDARQFAETVLHRPGAIHPPLFLIRTDEDSQARQPLIGAGYSWILRSPVNEDHLFNLLHSASPHTPADLARPGQVGDHPRLGARPMGQAPVLLAEDNPVNQRVLSQILEHAGYDVCLVDNGRDALEELLRRRFSLAILDMQMPEMGGLETLRRYRNQGHAEHGAVPVLILTATATVEAARECEAAGADGYLSKPVGSARLLDAVGTLICARPAPALGQGHGNITTSRPAIDPGKLDELAALGLDAEALSDLVSRFSTDTAALLHRMAEALRAGDYTAFSDLAHSVKGNAGDLGAMGLYQACRDAEHRTPEEYVRTGVQLLETIHHEFDQARGALETCAGKPRGQHAAP